MFLILLGTAGLCIFMGGMKLMKEGLENSARKSIQAVLEKLAGTPLKACITGLLITMLVQSSTAVSVLSVGFVNAGVMTLGQAIGILLGANVGTCATVQILAFDLTRFAVITGIAGLIIRIASKSTPLQNLGLALVGFGCIFTGLKLMNLSFAPLQYSDYFLQFLYSLTETPLLAVTAGAIASALLHSSSAATGIAMLLSGRELLPLETALAVVLGNNIGTCVTAVVASLSGSAAGKRVALAHVILNVAGAAVFFPLLPAFTTLVTFTAESLPRQVANAHTIFNMLSSIAAFPLLRPFTGLVEMLVPERKR